MTTILAAVGIGVLVLLAGNVPFNLLRALNLEAGVALPWAVLPAAPYLWAYWQFVGGRWGKGASAAKRRENLRANKLSGRVWGASLLAGLLGFGALVALLALAARLVALPSASPIVTPPGMPVATMFVLIVMGSIVAGVTEEAAFRGYMQGPIERRYGLATAILVNGTLFGLLHFPSHPADVVWMLPYYLAVSAVYGGLTCAANSILPALVLHAAGDVVVLTRWWLTGRPEWQIGSTVHPLVWDSGVDAHFVLTAIAAGVFVAATIGSYLAVRRLRLAERRPASGARIHDREAVQPRIEESFLLDHRRMSMRSAMAFVLLILALAAGSMPAHTDAQGASTEPVGAAGVWQGTLEAPGAQLRLVVKIRDEAGALAGTLDSIDQGARDLPIDTIRFADGKLEFEMRAIGGRFAGEIRAAGEIAGTWSQGGGSLPLTLRRDASLPVVARPQEPTRPLPYREEEVSYDSEPGVRLAATLTLPQGQGPFPAVVLITGSGPQDRDESLLGHRPFYILADSLTRRGIAVLRADDRGFGASTGDFAAASSEAFAIDALAGVRYLAARSDIRADAIGLVGHSEGGLVAPLAATRDAPEARNVAFLVLLAGPGVPLGEILVEQNRLLLAASGAPAAVIDTQIGTLERLIEIALEEPERDRAAAAMRSALNDVAATLPEATRAQIAGRIEPQVQQMNSIWMRWALAYDPILTLRALDVPVLALFGQRDLQVPPAQNRAPLEAALRDAGHPKSLVVELPGLNHLFQAAATGLPTEYATIEETMNPAALNFIGDWIVARVAEAP